MKFALIDDSNELGQKRFDTKEAAFEAANGLVSDDPNSTITVVQVVREYSSELKVNIIDVE